MSAMESDSPGELRQLVPRWNLAMIAASLAISFLGAFTATQLMCQASMSLHFSAVFMWSLLGSLIFGFCSIWSLHEVAMLAYEFDLPIQVDAPLTLLSALLAVGFTFVAVSSDLLWDRYRKRHSIRHHRPRYDTNKRSVREGRSRDPTSQISTPLLNMTDVTSDSGDDVGDEQFEAHGGTELNPPVEAFAANDEELAAFARSLYSSTPSISSGSTSRQNANDRSASRSTPPMADDASAVGIMTDGTESRGRTSSEVSYIRRSATGDSSSGSAGLSSIMGLRYNKTTSPAKAGISSIAQTFHDGFTPLNMAKGFLWSLAITSMHYVGILGLRIPNGYFLFNPWLVLLSATISWIVCTAGCILMGSMETHLPQQILFSFIEAAGVGAMHFTGMSATTFWTTSPSTDVRGYPPELANAVVAIAFLTCIIANVLLAHSATVSRNKLAEIVWTRKELWKAIALKETAETAARTRGEFIASASHEIRTPLHHLQGYSDLLAQTELTEEGRALLIAIQRATKTLSLSKSSEIAHHNWEVSLLNSPL
jgi:NO-binding membrane sensor protein with MHYT domain